MFMRFLEVTCVIWSRGLSSSFTRILFLNLMMFCTLINVLQIWKLPIRLLDVVFCFVSLYIPFSGDNNEILGPSLLMHSKRFEHDLFRWLRLVMMVVHFLQIVVSDEPDQIILLFVFNEHAIRWWIAGMIITKAMCTWRGSPGQSFSNRRGSPLRVGWSWHRSGPWSSLSQIGHGRSNCPRWYS